MIDKFKDKRFKHDKYCDLYDKEFDTFYPIADSETNIKLFCDRLNKLNDEHKEFKTILKNILIQLEYENSYHNPICKVTTYVTPKMYTILSKLMRCDDSMSDKRFMVRINQDTGEREYWDNDKHLKPTDVVDLLNQYDSEVKSQSHVIKGYQDRIDRVFQENQKLKKDNEYYRTERGALFEYLDKLDELKLTLRCDKK